MKHCDVRLHFKILYCFHGDHKLYSHKRFHFTDYALSIIYDRAVRKQCNKRSSSNAMPTLELLLTRDLMPFKRWYLPVITIENYSLSVINSYIFICCVRNTTKINNSETDSFPPLSSPRFKKNLLETRNH